MQFARYLFCLFLLISTSGSQSQILRKNSFLLQEQAESGLASNSITDIVINNEVIWFGTGRGLSKTSDSGLSFESFRQPQGLGRGGVSALAVRDDIVWVATGFDSLTDFGSMQTGGGLAYSQDDGATWNFVEQPGPTPVSNITFDIALRGDEVWITSFGGGLRRSSDLGQTWEVVTPDSFVFDPPSRLNHRAFSTINTDGTLWVGTAGGINRTLDSGTTWTNFKHDSTRGTETISGNFVVALAKQKFQDQEYIWAGTRPTTVESLDPTEFLAVSFSNDQGFTWKTTLIGETVHNFAFDDSVVYAASDRGLFKSIDLGENWFLFPAAENDDRTRRVLNSSTFSAAAESNHDLWLGTGNGLAKTSDSGLTWQIFQVFAPTGVEGAPRTYAYPNPFSPSVHNRLNGVGHVRFQYNTQGATVITLKIYNFAMEHVVTVVENGSRAAQSDLYETWDGRDKLGRFVHNGVYFYKLDLSGDGAYWGKLIVLK